MNISLTEIKEFVAAHSSWTYEDSALTMEKKFPGFMDAVAFVNKVADIAEQHNHHPDITIHYNKVTLLLTSHDTGNKVTEKDLKVAAAIEQL